ncbi:MAG: tripartite tricarboxylate transporter substrate binding protein [Candidatus Accumulibacter sp.]|jgi:tripartite-type tricarboxylate transporter receptor subunit TctC|nr:tripartite tricarboxylate transporter substrate binding protein [Accumulibacter sp.]
MISRKFLGAAALSLFATLASAAFPERDITGIIMWGAGGAMDVVSRAIQPHAEAALGKKIVMINRPGGTGAIATNFVNNAPNDGYNVLFGAENPQLHKVLGLAEFDYDRFFPVNILARSVGVIVVKADAPWKTLTELVDDARKRPGKIKMAMTGPGGLPHTVASMLGAVTKLEVVSVPFDGEGPAVTAVMGGHADFSPVGVGAATESIKAGRIRALAVVDVGPIDQLPGVPPVTREYPDFAKYLPWGPFYGVFVRKDTPDDVKAALADAFRKAADNAQFKQLMADRGNIMMNVSGAQADAFLTKWQSVTSWLLQDVGVAKVSPEKYGIAKP